MRQGFPPGLKRLPPECIAVITNFERDLLGFWYTNDNGVRIPLALSEVVYRDDRIRTATP